MKIAYIRKSTRTFEETLKALQEHAAAQGWKELGQAPLPEEQGTMLLLCRPDWLGPMLKQDLQVLGFIPCSVSVLKRNREVLVAVSQLMTLLAQSPAFAELAEQASTQLRELVHRAAGVAEPVLKKIKLYSTQSCPYCRMEKSWLESQKIAFEEVYVDLNQEEAEKLVRNTGQLGVPVTEFLYDDGEAEYVIGFDRERLAKMLQANKSLTVSWST